MKYIALKKKKKKRCPFALAMNTETVNALGGVSLHRIMSQTCARADLTA